MSEDIRKGNRNRTWVRETASFLSRSPELSIGHISENTTTPLGGYHSQEMVYIAPVPGLPRVNASPGAARIQVKEEPRSESLADNKPKSYSPVSPVEVAERVYRMMQKDLRLERERTTR